MHQEYNSSVCYIEIYINIVILKVRVINDVNFAIHVIVLISNII